MYHTTQHRRTRRPVAFLLATVWAAVAVLIPLAPLHAQADRSRSDPSTDPGASQTVTAAPTGIMAHGDVVVIQEPAVGLNDRVTRDTLERAVVRAAHHLARADTPFLVTVPWSTPEHMTPIESRDTYTISIHIAGNAGTQAPPISLAIVRGGASPGLASITIAPRWDALLYRTLAQTIVYLWAQIQENDLLAASTQPFVVDHLDMSELEGTLLPPPAPGTAGGDTDRHHVVRFGTPTGGGDYGRSALLYPRSAAAIPGEGVVIGAVAAAVRFDHVFRIRDVVGTEEVAAGTFDSAWAVDVGPAGSIVTQGAVGSRLQRYVLGSDTVYAHHPTWTGTNPLPGRGPMTVLSDGSIVVVDPAVGRAVRVHGVRRNLLPGLSRPDQTITAVASGPEATIWAYDVAAGAIVVVSWDGRVRETIRPAIPQRDAASVRSIAVNGCGESVLLGPGGVWRVRRNGLPVWHVGSLGGAGERRRGTADRRGTFDQRNTFNRRDTFDRFTSVAWDASMGALWLTDYLGRRVVRLQEDRSVVAIHDEGQGFSEAYATARRITELSARAETSLDAADRTRAAAQKALLYEERGAREMAHQQWRAVLDADPFHPDAADRIAILDAAIRRERTNRAGAVEAYDRERANRDPTAAAHPEVESRGAVASIQPSDLVDPYDAVVVDFVRHVARNSRITYGPTPDPVLSPTFSRMVILTEALARYGLSVRDQDGGAGVGGSGGGVPDGEHLQTRVQPPSTTLYHAEGSSLDLAVLMSSVLEAAGLQTALIPTAGTTVVGVNIEEPAVNRWVFEAAGLAVVSDAGTLWVPLHPEALGDGFLPMWTRGSTTVRADAMDGASVSSGSSDFDIIPVASMRRSQTAGQPRVASFTVTAPSPGETAPSVARAVDEVRRVLYDRRVVELETERNRRAGSRRLPILNRLGVLHGRFRRWDQAEAVLADVVERRGSHLAAMVNLANVALLRGRPTTALQWLDAAELLAPDDPVVVELLARAHAAADDGRTARRYALRLAQLEPGREEALITILPRSGRAALPRPTVWDDEAGGARWSSTPWPVTER